MNFSGKKLPIKILDLCYIYAIGIPSVKTIVAGVLEKNRNIKKYLL